MERSLLPLGSVVTLLLDESPAFCVAGYYPVVDSEAHDYLGVPWPTGIFEGSDALAFDEGTIASVLFEANAIPEELELLATFAELHAERQRLAQAALEELSTRETADTPA